MLHQVVSRAFRPARPLSFGFPPCTIRCMSLFLQVTIVCILLSIPIPVRAQGPAIERRVTPAQQPDAPVKPDRATELGKYVDSCVKPLPLVACTDEIIRVDKVILEREKESQRS